MKDSVQQDNRRALPKFLAVVAASAVLGRIGGFFAAPGAKPEMVGDMRTALDRVM